MLRIFLVIMDFGFESRGAGKPTMDFGFESRGAEKPRMDSKTDFGFWIK